MEAPLSTSEADLLAMEEKYDTMIVSARRVRYHLTECEHGDAKTLADFDELLKYIDIYDEVVKPEPITQPTAEMAAGDF